MKLQKYIITILMIIVVLSGGYANAGEEDITLTSVLKFSAGIVVGFAIHESGHILTAYATDTDIDIEWGSIIQPLEITEHADSDSKIVAINSAGLISQAIGTEVILQVDKIDKNDAFVRGIMTCNILNPILYAIDYWFIHNTNWNKVDTYQGDIAGIERYTSKRTANVFALIMVGVATFQGYRFLKTQSWAPDWLKNKSHNLNIEPLPSGGLAMMYEIVF